MDTERACLYVDVCVHVCDVCICACVYNLYPFFLLPEVFSFQCLASSVLPDGDRCCAGSGGHSNRMFLLLPGEEGVRFLCKCHSEFAILCFIEI